MTLGSGGDFRETENRDGIGSCNHAVDGSLEGRLHLGGGGAPRQGEQFAADVVRARKGGEIPIAGKQFEGAQMDFLVPPHGIADGLREGVHGFDAVLRDLLSARLGSSETTEEDQP